VFFVFYDFYFGCLDLWATIKGGWFRYGLSFNHFASEQGWVGTNYD